MKRVLTVVAALAVASVVASVARHAERAAAVLASEPVAVHSAAAGRSDVQHDSVRASP